MFGSRLHNTKQSASSDKGYEPKLLRHALLVKSVINSIIIPHTHTRAFLN